ncbi:DNA adenine methylase [Fervidibacillus albus]|uniref:site-specific DNA-methyltransferase (adenine-specific) n=1 Tax=Fervidibacillus albus TaxID=2980026 RepID=A0A9E8LV80_9BACI|nr:DNA adenine methylase [Fervidibacillus albus]WAA10315.1 DNA adenine methylase [Fervidibacillus albus]
MSVARILHYPGSKWSLADWIIRHMPEHQTYLEPFFGSGVVFFNKPRSPLETINDIDGDVVNLFKMIRDQSVELARMIEWTPYSREEYYKSFESEGTNVEKARRFLVRCWMARGAKTNVRTGWRHVIDFSKRPSSPAREWMTLPKRILSVAERLKGAQIENQMAIKLIKRYKRENVLIYADPPYVNGTRTNRHYKFEMSSEDHIELLEALNAHPGPVLLSGYDNEIYNKMLENWKKDVFTVRAEAGTKRTEVLWINRIAAENGYLQQTLF